MQKLQALRECKPSDKSSARHPSPSPPWAWDLIIHTAGDRLTRTASPSRRLGRVTACVSQAYAQNSTLGAAPLRPAPSLSEHRRMQLAGLPAQEDLFDTTTAAVAVRVCQCSASARPTTHADSSQPSFVCHHYSWDTVMLQVQAGPTGPIALAGLVNSLHASSSACPPGPVSVVP